MLDVYVFLCGIMRLVVIEVMFRELERSVMGSTLLGIFNSAMIFVHEVTAIS